MASKEHNLEPEFEALLKAHIKQRATTAVCHQFDLDEATAYLEHALNKTALTAFEAHLVSCAVCRRHLIELSHLMPPQPVAAEPLVFAPSFKERFSECVSGWRLGAFAGIGAIAATVLLIAVFVTRSSLETTSLIATRQPEEKADALPASAVSPAANQASKTIPSASPAPGAPMMDKEAAAKANPSATPTSPPALSENSPAVVPPPPPPSPPASLPAASKVEFERKENSPPVVAGQSQIQNLRGQTPAGPEVNQSQVDRALDRARKDNEPLQKSADAMAVAPAPAKPAPKAEAEKQSERVVEKRRAEMDEAVEPKKSKERMAKPVSTAAASGSRGRVVSGKTFRQENGVWIDEAYDLKQGLPIVRLTRDSEEYKQALKETPALKPYFDLKPVLVVWQGTVYRVANK